jgi:hypothetical protein
MTEMPILRKAPRVQPPVGSAVDPAKDLRSSAQSDKQAGTYRDGREWDGISSSACDEVTVEAGVPEGARDLDQRITELIKQNLPSGFALVTVEADARFKQTSNDAGQNEIFRIVRQGMTTLRELNSRPGVGVMWRINWILAELADFGIHLRWTSPHVPFLELP